MAYMRYYRSLLNEKEKKAYDALICGIAKREDKISVDKISKDELERVHKAVNFDYPDFFYVNFYQYAYTMYFRRTEIQIKYTMDAFEAKRIKKEIDKIAEEIVARARGLSELETEKFLNDELRKIAVYDRNPLNTFNAQNLIGTFIDGKCVCEGFAKSFKYLADMLQLKSIIVVGNGGLSSDNGPHAWNIVKIDGESYHLDVTYNQVIKNPLTGNIKYFSRAYFNLSDKEILRDHTIDPLFKVPSCRKSRSEVSIISSTSELIDHLRNESSQSKQYTEMRFTKHFKDINEITRMIEKSITLRDYKWYGKIKTFTSSNYSIIIEWR